MVGPEADFFEAEWVKMEGAVIAEIFEAIFKQRKDVSRGCIDVGFAALIQRQKVHGGNSLRIFLLGEIKQGGAPAEAKEGETLARFVLEEDFGIACGETGKCGIERIASDQIAGCGSVCKGEDRNGCAGIHAIFPWTDCFPSGFRLDEKSADSSGGDRDRSDGLGLEIRVDFRAYGCGWCTEEAVKCAFTQLPYRKGTKECSGDDQEDGEDDGSQNFKFSGRRKSRGHALREEKTRPPISRSAAGAKTRFRRLMKET